MSMPGESASCFEIAHHCSPVVTATVGFEKLNTAEMPLMPPLASNHEAPEVGNQEAQNDITKQDQEMGNRTAQTNLTTPLAAPRTEPHGRRSSWLARVSCGKRFVSCGPGLVPVPKRQLVDNCGEMSGPTLKH